MDNFINLKLLFHPMNWLIVLIVLAIGGCILSQLSGHLNLGNNVNAADNYPD